MSLVATIAFVLLLRGAVACDACDGVMEFTATTTEVSLEGDLRECACVFAFKYSTGSLGKVLVSASGADAAVSVYDGPDEDSLVASFGAADLLRDTVVFSRTGVVVVALSTGATPEAGARVGLWATAVNQAPVMTEREGLDKWLVLGTIFLPIPFSGHALPVMVRDADNNDQGLRAELSLTAGFEAGDPLTWVVVPPVDGVTFEIGAADTPSRWVVLSGPGSAVEEALDRAQLVPFALDFDPFDVLQVTVSDLGNAGEGSGPLVSEYQAVLHVYAKGVINVSRGEQLVDAGQPPNLIGLGTDAVFLVHGAAQIHFTELALVSLAAEGLCGGSFLRVYDGASIASGRLLSTDLAPTGEICGDSTLLPTYTASTGEFVVEFVSDGTGRSNFDTVVTPTPKDFCVWLLDDAATDLEAVAGGGPIVLPRIMVTSLPDPTNITVTVSASVGTIGLRFADSFVDVVAADSLSSSLLSLCADGMLRMGDVLQEVTYTPPDSEGFGRDTIVVRAWSGTVQAKSLSITVAVGHVAINVPSSLSVHAFQPVVVPLEVTGKFENVLVKVSSGIGLVSADTRAEAWVDVGFSETILVPRKTRKIVYKAQAGGNDTIVVVAGGETRLVNVAVDPECSGAHFIYSRSGTITERAGPVADQHSSDTLCTWTIVGARTLLFPYYELEFLTHHLAVSDSTKEMLFGGPFTFGPPGMLVSEEPEPFFFVLFDALGDPGRGFVGVLGTDKDVNDPPVIVVPAGPVQVTRSSRTGLPSLYIDDFDDGPIVAAIETDVGTMSSGGINARSFAELDAWATSVEFLAPDAQTTATITVTATDADGASASAAFVIEILPCQGTVGVVVAADGEAIVADGSGLADYIGGLSCGWQLTGAGAPAVLDVEFVDVDCSSGGDAVTVYDGSNIAGRELGRLCTESDGALVSSTGSFFVAFVTDNDGIEADGFSFVYRSLGATQTTVLGSVPVGQDPVRTGSAVVGLFESTVVVFGGHNGVRAVSSALLFDTEGGWRVLDVGADSASPSARSECAGSALDARTLVVHGGQDATNAVLSETWIAEIDLDTLTVAWTLASTSGPATASSGMHGRYLVAESGVWALLDRDSWTLVGETRDGIVSTTLSGTSGSATGYATATDGSIWSVDLAVAEWTAIGAMVVAGSAHGAMLGSSEYVSGSQRVNVTTGGVSVLPLPDGTPIGGTYFGAPAVFVFGGGTMQTVALTLGVSDHAPLVTPYSGGTILSVRGERLTTCGAAVCAVGGARFPLTAVSERRGWCTTPPSSSLVSLASTLSIVCDDGRELTSPSTLYYFGQPRIGAIEPRAPQAGEAITIEILGIDKGIVAAAGSSALCRFNGAVTAGASIVDGTRIRCAIPLDASGLKTTVEISLDGQQFAAESATIDVGEAKEQAPLFDNSAATIGGLVLAGVLGVGSVTLYLQSPDRTPRVTILSVALGVVDFYFDVVFASKLRDEASGLAEWSGWLLVALVVLNLTLMIDFVVRKLWLSAGRHAFVQWLSQNGSMLGLSVVCLFGLVRVNALALLMTRLGGLAMFDAAGMSVRDWHWLAALDVGTALVEDVGQLAVQIVYLNGDNAEVDTATVVTIGLSTVMIIFAVFQGLARVAMFAAAQRRSSRVHVGMVAETT